MAKKSFFSSPAFIIGSTAITVIGGAFIGSKISKKIKERKQENAANQVDNKDPKRALAATLAQKCFVSFFPSGYTSFPDGTDEQALFNVAKQMFVNKIPFSYLTEAYRKLYSRQFALDLADELDAADLTRFYSFFNKGIGNITTNLL